MADPDPNLEDSVFHLERIRQLIELMKEHELSEIDLRQAEQRIRLSRGAGPEPVLYAAPAPAAPTPLAAAPAIAEEEAHIAYIRSPMVGTFYSRANPNAEPFVKVGDHVNAERVICIVEAMKVFNEIPAEANGRILAVLVEDEEPVDFGRPLFKIDTRN